MPPLNADERTTLESWLDFHRTTLAMKYAALNYLGRDTEDRHPSHSPAQH
jgi:hypothetical protein